MHLNFSGTKGQGVPVEVSQRSWYVQMGMETLSKCRVVCIVCSAVMSG